MPASRRRLAAAFAGVLAMTGVGAAMAQPPGFGGGRGGPGGPPAAARDAAPVDLTGTWVSLVTEDWIERMSPDSPASGTGGGGFGFGGGGGRGGGRGGNGPAAVTSSDPCAAYGAGGIMRVPGRIKIGWQDDDTLLLEYDAGSQRRLIHFDAAAPASAGNSLQGYSTASWENGGGGRGRQGGFGGPGGGRGGAAETSWASLAIVTRNLSAGYLVSSRSWYGDGASVTELVRYHRDFGQEYFTVTAIVEDNGRETSTTSSTFKKEPDDSKFDAGGCEIKPR